MTSMRRTVANVLVGALAAIPGAVAVGGPAAAYLNSPAPHVLLAGQRLTTGTPQNRLMNGEFVLGVGTASLVLYQILTLPGSRGDEYVQTTAWNWSAKAGKSTGKASLIMRRNGNAVLVTSRGDTLWSTHTAGTGANNRFVLSALGNLAVITGAGKVVWSSHTGRLLLGAGGVLTSGQRMVDAKHEDWKGSVPQTLTMQANGNLVRRCGRYVLWQSRTHTPGSRMILRDDGDLLISSPAGRTVWSSRSGGYSSYVYLEMTHMTITQVIPHRKVIWQRGWQRNC